MRLHELSVTAFGPFVDTVHVDLDELAAGGLFLLTGDTGAGKSSILDAVCFALYGEVPGDRHSARHLRSDHASPEAEPLVVLRFSIGERTFRFTRSPAWDRPRRRGEGTRRIQAHVVVEEQRGGEWSALTNRLDDAGHLVTGLLGMTCTQFTQVAMLPQGRFQTFLRATSSERHAVLQRLFRTRRFEDVERWLAERRVQLHRRSQASHERCSGVVARLQEQAGASLPEGWDVHDLEAHVADATLTAWTADLLGEATAALVRHAAELEVATGDLLARRELLDLGRAAAAARQRGEQAQRTLDALAASRDEEAALLDRLDAHRRAAPVVPAARRSAACCRRRRRVRTGGPRAARTRRRPARRRPARAWALRPRRRCGADPRGSCRRGVLAAARARAARDPPACAWPGSRRGAARVDAGVGQRRGRRSRRTARGARGHARGDGRPRRAPQCRPSSHGRRRHGAGRCGAGRAADRASGRDQVAAGGGDEQLAGPPRGLPRPARATHLRHGVRAGRRAGRGLLLPRVRQLRAPCSRVRLPAGQPLRRGRRPRALRVGRLRAPGGQGAGDRLPDPARRCPPAQPGPVRRPLERGARRGRRVARGQHRRGACGHAAARPAGGARRPCPTRRRHPDDDRRLADRAHPRARGGRRSARRPRRRAAPAARRPPGGHHRHRPRRVADQRDGAAGARPPDPHPPARGVPGAGPGHRGGPGVRRGCRVRRRPRRRRVGPPRPRGRGARRPSRPAPGGRSRGRPGAHAGRRTPLAEPACPGRARARARRAVRHHRARRGARGPRAGRVPGRPAPVRWPPSWSRCSPPGSRSAASTPSRPG